MFLAAQSLVLQADPLLLLILLRNPPGCYCFHVDFLELHFFKHVFEANVTVKRSRN